MIIIKHKRYQLIMTDVSVQFQEYAKNLDRDDLVYHARLAEQAERYDDMTEFMKGVAKNSGDKPTLSVEERNLLSVAYKNVIGSRRAAWRVLSNLESKELHRGSDAEKISKIKEYRQRVEEELDSVCDEIIKIIEDHLLQANNQEEAAVFYHKMCGDYYRYLAEFKKDEEREAAAQSALEKYEEAQKIATGEGSHEGLAPTHPIRLGLALNLSVFYYEILGQQNDACELAKTAFDQAIADLDTLKEDSYKDATLIMQLLRDNLTLWTSDGEEEKYDNANADQE